MIATFLSPTFIKYSVIGLMGLAVNLVSFWFLYEVFSIHYLVANVVSDLLSIIHNFLLNAFFNFNVRDALLRRFFIYGAVWLSGLLISSAILWVGVNIFEVAPLIGKMIAVPVILIYQYTFNALVTFKHSSSEKN